MFKTILIVLAVTIVTLIVMACVDKITTEIAKEGDGEVLVASDPEGIEVTLSGEVELAGTYLLPINSTLYDAIKAAGGVTSNADTKCYDTSFVLDGDIAFYIAPIYDNSNTCSLEPIKKANLNADDAQTLQEVAGFTKTVANAIVNYRISNSFACLEDMKNVSGVGQATYISTRDKLTLRGKEA